MDVHKETIQSIKKDIFEKRIVTTSIDGIIRIFENKSQPDNALDFSLECEIKSDHGSCLKAVFMHNNEYIAASFSSGMLLILKKDFKNSYAIKYEHQVYTGVINDISSSYNNKYNIHCACADGKIRTVSFQEGENLQVSEITAHRFGISTIDSNSNFIVSGGIDYSIAIWENEKEIVRFRDHSCYVREVCIAPDNIFSILCFASCGDDGKVFIYWKYKEEYLKQEIVLDGPVYSLIWSKSGFTLSIGYGSNKFKCYEPKKDGKFEEVELIKEN
ncbi:protein transport protein SEC13 [Vairimorpha necatrix]|uniref:Protein transport protein SEC13 n=1 Tax=Vairimorpha necatrix TaxID=6039 RepID=A0AAX4J8D2_9MICR